MRLTEQEYYQFLRLHTQLIYFVFAIYEDTILCSAENSTELNKMVHSMVKNVEHRKGVYVFKI